MASDLIKLKKEAIKLGMDKSTARGANRSTLQNFIDGAGKAPAKKKGSTTTTAAKKKASTSSTTRKKAAPAAKKSASTGKAKRAAVKPKAKRNSSNDGGRNMIGSLDFTVEDGWNPRANSPVAVIFKAIKKTKGNVDKAFDILAPNVRDFVSTKKADGTKRTKDEMHKMLRYRINRTIWQFAMQTGQHEASTNRVEYGTGDYASKTRKPARKAANTRKNSKPNTRKAAAKPKGRAKAKRR